MRQELINHLDDLEDLANLLKSSFVGKDQIVELMIICAMAQEHLLIVGPPGTAKSELVKRFALLCSPPHAGGRERTIPYFEYLLTRFTEPNELFGPVDIKTYQEQGEHRRITAGMLPRAEVAFLDEIFKANSAILNALLTILNERVYYNGGKAEVVPLLYAIGATNEVPDDSSLAALYDRFLVRVWSDNVEESRFSELFQQGWQLEKARIRTGYKMSLGNVITTAVLRSLYRSLDEVNLEPVASHYREVVRRIRSEGIELSDRRVIKLLKLIAASALRRKSLEAHAGDFWVLKHVWNDPDQMSHIAAIIDPYLEESGVDLRRPERRLELIDNDLTGLTGQQESLRTDADFADFLHQAESLRRELLGHSDSAGAAVLLDRAREAIEETMTLLEQHG
ncbi:MAG: AAA family ATPase [Deltaproteobacteria bacterium]|nr:AAA family ATPase [Candidatus Anaeroferrophillus wilburensis]MBN2890165.1 AAA family ATPase [Deltaproteobacteria bacterium]